jgi:hypothetical protein
MAVVKHLADVGWSLLNLIFTCCCSAVIPTAAADPVLNAAAAAAGHGGDYRPDLCATLLLWQYSTELMIWMKK